MPAKESNAGDDFIHIRRPSTAVGKISKASRKPDTGVFWDEPLDLYLGGAININLYNNILGFTAGDTINGTIDIEIDEKFDASELVIEFCGVERSHLKHTNTNLKTQV